MEQPKDHCNIEPEKEPLTWKFWRKRRYIVVMLACFGFANMYGLRVNLSVAIVAMTENRTIYYENGTIQGYEQYFAWSSTEQGIILSSFFYGYILTPVLGGYIGGKIGGSLLFGFGTFVTALLTFITPIAAKYGGIIAIIIIRVIEGIFEGVTYPCIHAIFSQWAPPLERARMGTVALSGAHFGTSIALPICGVLSRVWGWESLFYLFGVIACIWYVAWVLIVRKSPEKDKHITEDELKYIQRTLNRNNNKNTDNNNTDDEPHLVHEIDKKKLPIVYPWKSIFTSKPVYAIIISTFCEFWGFLTFTTHLPTFLKDKIGYDLNSVGFLSALPYLAMGILLWLAGYLADFFQVKGWLNTSQVRRYFNCLSFLGQTVFLLLAAYASTVTQSIICITIAVGLGAFAVSAFAVNHLDLAPQYASVLMGISGTMATVPGIISPVLTGYIVKTGSADEWKIVFFITSSLYLIGAIFYWFWSSGELQPWAMVGNEQNTINKNTKNLSETNVNNKKCEPSTKYVYTNNAIENE